MSAELKAVSDDLVGGLRDEVGAVLIIAESGEQLDRVLVIAGVERRFGDLVVTFLGLIGAVLVVAESLEHFGRGGIIAVSHQLRGLLVVRRIAAGNREHYSYHKDCRKYLFDVFHIFSFLFLLSCGD